MRLQISGPYCWKAGSVHFLRGEREFGRLLSSQWIKVLSPLQWLITTTENEGERGRERERQREREIKGDRDLGGRQLMPLMVGLLCTLASHFRSKAHTEHSSIKHSSQQGRLDVLSVSVHPNGLWQWHTSAYRSDVSMQMQNANRMSTFANITVKKLYQTLRIHPCRVNYRRPCCCKLAVAAGG